MDYQKIPKVIFTKYKSFLRQITSKKCSWVAYPLIYKKKSLGWWKKHRKNVYKKYLKKNCKNYKKEGF